MKIILESNKVTGYRYGTYLRRERCLGCSGEEKKRIKMSRLDVNISTKPSIKLYNSSPRHYQPIYIYNTKSRDWLMCTRVDSNWYSPILGCAVLPEKDLNEEIMKNVVNINLLSCSY